MMELSQVTAHFTLAFCRDSVQDWNLLLFGPTELIGNPHLHTPLVGSTPASQGTSRRRL